jgi:hypothetical protein
MSKQTAVEWLVKQLLANGDIRWRGTAIHDLAEQAKAMEKEQIEDAWDKRCSHGVVSQTWHIETKNGEAYYKETYGGDK